MPTFSFARFTRSRPLALALGTLLLALSAGGAATAAPGKLVVSFLDVGQGDSELLQMPSGEAVLIDGGDVEMGPRVVADLKARGVKSLDMVIMSHPHADHIGGLDKVIEAFPVRLVLDAGQSHGSRTYSRLLKTIERKGVPLKLGRAGMTKQYGPVRMEVLAPAEPLLEGTHSDPNNNSIVTRFVYGDVSFLMTGDIEKEGLPRLMASNRDLSATILKVPHHGSRYTTTDAFLAAIKPRVAVISAGEGNDYGHPHKQAVARLTKAGAKIHVTAQAGTVTVTTDGRGYTVATER